MKLLYVQYVFISETHVQMNVFKVMASQHTFVFAAQKEQIATEHHLISAQKRYDIIFILCIVHTCNLLLLVKPLYYKRMKTIFLLRFFKCIMSYIFTNFKLCLMWWNAHQRSSSSQLRYYSFSLLKLIWQKAFHVAKKMQTIQFWRNFCVRTLTVTALPLTVTNTVTIDSFQTKC